MVPGFDLTAQGDVGRHNDPLDRREAVDAPGPRVRDVVVDLVEILPLGVGHDRVLACLDGDAEQVAVVGEGS